MTTLRIQNLICPHCQNKMYAIGVMSFTIRNSEVYSDGRVETNPPRPNEHKILICTICYNAFWKEDALLKNEDYKDDLNELPEANTISDLFPGFKAEQKLKRIQYYSELLNTKFANTKEREVYLRIELWHTINDGIRYTQIEMDISTKSIFENNLKKLIDVYEPKNDEEQLLMIEMYRELGAYDKALYFLESLKGINVKQAFLKIKKAIKNKNSRVFKI